MRKIIGAAALLTTTFATPAFGHHSFAMFDLEKEITIEGTVKDFQWTNPHIWIDVNVPNARGGGFTSWPVEGGALTGLRGRGWNKDVLKPGDKVSVNIRPLRSGKPGGSLIKVTLPDGKIFQDATGDAHRNAGKAEPIIPGLNK